MKTLAGFKTGPGLKRLAVIAPSDVGMKSIGHAGAFRTEAPEALWPLIESYLHAAA